MPGPLSAAKGDLLTGALVATVLTAAVTYAAARFVLPALGVTPKSGLTFLPEITRTKAIRPEPLEQQRYLLAALAALTIPISAVALTGRTRLAQHVPRHAALVLQAAIIVLVAAAWHNAQPAAGRWWPLVDGAGILIPLAITAAVLLWRGPAGRLTRGRGRPVELAAGLAALAVAGLGTSVGLYTDSSLFAAFPTTYSHIPFTFQEAYAVAAGHTPLVDWTPQYTTIIPYVVSPLLSLRPPSVGMFTATMVAINAFGMMCIYVAMRLLAGRPLRALLLFAGIAAIGLIPAHASGTNVHSAANYFAAMPLRTAGPLLCLAAVALLARRPARRSAWALFGALEVLVLLNNFEWGLPAAAAGLVAALLSQAPDTRPSRATIRRLPAMAAGGAAAFALFLLLTLVRSGSLPDLWELVSFNRQFAVAGFFMLPIHGGVVSLPGLIFATFVAATVVGVAPALAGRAAPGDAGRVTTAVLTFSGIFGIGAFAYYVGRSHPDVLGALFLPWAVALGALACTSLRYLCGPAGLRRPAAPLAALAVAAFVTAGIGAVAESGYGLAQPKRILDRPAGLRIFAQSEVIAVARRCIPAGSDVSVMYPLGARIASAAGLRDRFPFNHPGAMVTRQQVDEALAVAKRHDARIVISNKLYPSIDAMLRNAGYRRVLHAMVPPANTEEINLWQQGPGRLVRCGS